MARYKGKVASGRKYVSRESVKGHALGVSAQGHNIGVDVTAQDLGPDKSDRFFIEVTSGQSYRGRSRTIADVELVYKDGQEVARVSIYDNTESRTNWDNPQIVDIEI